jgi:hypothetical protein
MTRHFRRSILGHGHRRRSLGALAALLILAGAPLVSTTPVGAASNGLWSVYPTTVPGQPSRVFVEPELVPGKTYADSVTVANYTGASLDFNLYGSDAFNTPGGGLSLRRRTDPQVDIGKWIVLPTAMLVVPAHGQSVVPFTINPPAAATPGDHVGGIVAEETQGTTSNQGSVPVTVIQAVAVRVYGRVKGPLKPQLSVRKTSMTLTRPTSSQFGGPVSARVRFTLTNSGNEVLSPETRVALTTPFGTAAHRSIEVGQLLPGNTLTYSLAFANLTALGHLQAEVTATALHAKATGSAKAWVLPWGLFGIVIVVLLVLLFLALRHRKRRRAASKELEDPEVTEPALAE